MPGRITDALMHRSKWNAIISLWRIMVSGLLVRIQNTLAVARASGSRKRTAAATIDSPPRMRLNVQLSDVERDRSDPTTTNTPLTATRTANNCVRRSNANSGRTMMAKPATAKNTPSAKAVHSMGLSRKAVQASALPITMSAIANASPSNRVEASGVARMNKPPPMNAAPLTVAGLIQSTSMCSRFVSIRPI